jgi:superkiller protein 3
MSNTDEFMKKGDEYFDDGRFNQALQSYKRVLNYDSKNIDALICCGLCYRNLKNYDKAIEFYDNALEIEPDNKTALNNKGYALEMKDQIDDAIEYYKKSLEIDATYEMPLVNLTKIYLDKKDYDAAINIYKEALDIDPLNTANWIDLGRAYRFLEEYENAIHAYKKALKLVPSNKIAWNNIGYVYLQRKEYEKAINAFTESLKIDWIYDLPYSNLNKLYKELKESEYDDFNLWKQLANAFLVARAYKRALDASHQMLNIKPNNNDAKKLQDKILDIKQKFDMTPILVEKIQHALDLFSSISSTALLSDIIEYIKYKNPELIFSDEDIKFNIFETIRKKGIYAKLVVNKLVFYKRIADSEEKVDYMK